VSSEILLLDRTPVLRNIPSGNTVRRCLPFKVNSSKPCQMLLLSGFMCCPNRCAEGVSPPFPDPALGISLPGVFLARDSDLYIPISKHQLEQINCFSYKQNTLGVFAW
jgi:hypothetical protein